MFVALDEVISDIAKLSSADLSRAVGQAFGPKARGLRRDSPGRWPGPEPKPGRDALKVFHDSAQEMHQNSIATISCQTPRTIDWTDEGFGTTLGIQIQHLPDFCEVSNKKLLETCASLLVTSAILVVTMFAIRNKCIATSDKCLTSSNNVCY